MRHIKSILLALFFSVAILYGAGLLLRPEYKVERSVLIKCPPDSISPFLSNLKNWPEWSAWNTKKDPSLQLSYAGPEEGIGAKQKWTGEVMDKGALEIIRMVKGKELEYRLLSGEGFISHGRIRIESKGSGSKVSWEQEGNAGDNIPQRYFILFMDNLAGSDMEEGLAKLKKICESE